MKISEQWLREWVNPELDFVTIGEQLTMAGCEVDAVEAVASDFSGVIVAEIISFESHPDADRLRVCQVNNGQDTLQIVCGAPNVKVGMKAALAQVGALLPMPAGKPLKIKSSKLRGVPSNGMLCSASELGVAEKSDGLLELPADAPVGEDLRSYLKLDDQVLELGITPNRGDCLSVAGLARETAALTKVPLNKPVMAAIPAQHQESRQIDLPAPDFCPRYVGRVIRNINPQAETPLWMKEKLRRQGLRSLSAAVDVTNYVMMELGQPMHAFDLDKLEGGVRARYAHENEALTLLDSKEIKLNPEMLVIADSKKALALAGIMGGADSAVTDQTQHIFLESAHFRPEKIAGKARLYGLQTDSSYRFERGVDPSLASLAMERATELLIAICGGEAGPSVDQNVDSSLLSKTSITLRRQRIKRLLGVTLPDQTIQGILARLGCELTDYSDGWHVAPPLNRFDLRIEADLIEELARIHGYNAIPANERAVPPKLNIPLEGQCRLNSLQDTLISRGYQEAVTYSFVDPKLETLLQPEAKRLLLANPISAELALMRSTLWSGLLPALQYNVNRQQERVRLFEIGPAFEWQDGELLQERKLAGVLTGPVYAEQWGQALRDADFYDAKGDVEVLLAQASQQTFHFVAAQHPALHPGQSAQIFCDEQPVGWLGTLHPRLMDTLDLEKAVYLFEIKLAALRERRVPHYQAVSKFPAIRRDLALVMEGNIPMSKVDQVIKENAPKHLIHWDVFDIYTGQGIDSGQKSVALSLILQDFSSTLEDSKVNHAVNKVIAALHQETGAILR